jgi:hypothetical protein
VVKAVEKINDLQAAYNLAAWTLDKSLVKLAILIQNENVVEAKSYAECAAKVQPVRESSTRLKCG